MRRKKNIPPFYLENKSIFFGYECEPQKEWNEQFEGSQFIVIYFKMNSTIDSIST